MFFHGLDPQFASILNLSVPDVISTSRTDLQRKNKELGSFLNPEIHTVQCHPKSEVN